MSEATSFQSYEGFERLYVETHAALHEVADMLRRADAIGVDVEMGQRMIRRPGGAQEWKHILALIQIAGGGVSVVIDPLRCGDLTPLRPLLAGRVRKVFLGGGQDAALLEEAGIPARTIADVGEVAYSVFGRREDGMAALSKRIFGLSLDKTIRRTDWLVRPLNPSLISYAHQDAELTLLIYRWFQSHFPVELAMHERREIDPQVPSDVADWLRDALLRGASDPAIIVSEHSLEPTRDDALLAEDIRAAMSHFAQAPRRMNRLVRIAAELGLRALLPDILPLADSRSSLLRASAARAVAKLAEPDAARAALERLARDPIEDVRKAAEAGQRELKSAKKRAAEEPEKPEEEAEAGLDEDTMSALRRLMQQLGGDSA